MAQLEVRDDEFVELATAEFAAALRDAVSAYERRGRRAAALLGSPREYARELVESSMPVVSPWDDVAGPFLRTAGVQAKLGISRQAVAAKARRRRLLRVITADGEHLYPAWQFDGRRLVDGLADVLAMFGEDDVDGWTLAGWLRTSDPDLGVTPFDALVAGRLEPVIASARSAARALSGR